MIRNRNKRRFTLLFTLVLLIGFYACKDRFPANYPQEIKVSVSENDLKKTDSNKFWAVVGTAAGYLPRYSYLPKSRTLALDSSWKALDFLPLPANQGFVIDAIDQSTHPIEVMILSESLPPGEAIELQVVASITLGNDQDQKNVIIGIPSQPDLRVIDPKDFTSFNLEYDAIKFQIQNWYLNYLGRDKYDLVKWENEQFANSFIEIGRKNFSD